MKTIILNLLILGALFSAVIAITIMNPVISVIFVILTFAQVAAYLILIGIHFIGVSYIIIYVGAIAVLFLFVIMMINIDLSEIVVTGSQFFKNLVLGLVLLLIFISIIYSLIPLNYNNVAFLDYLISPDPKQMDPSAIGTYVTYKQLKVSPGYSVFPTDYYYIYNNLLINNLAESDNKLVYVTQVQSLGEAFYTYAAVLFFVLSMILLLAMFAIILSSNKKNQLSS